MTAGRVTADAPALRIGSMCTGYGGLDLAVHAVLGGDLAWFAEVDPDASRVLAHRFPDVPNLCDLTAVDWSAAEPVDVLTAGFPCQPVSAAGRRRGVDDERWLWDDICRAVGRMDPRPGLLVFENVRGLLSANGGDAMARVVQGLASLGYVGRYRLLRASDIGAPHRRERVFIAARPVAHAGGVQPERRRDPRLVVRPATPDGPAGQERDERNAAVDRDPTTTDASRVDQRERADQTHAFTASGPAWVEPGGRGVFPLADAPGDGWDEGWPEPARVIGRLDAPVSGSGAVADPTGERHGDRGTASVGGVQSSPVSSGLRDVAPGPIVDWRQYGPAIARWEMLMGRPAPVPTVMTRNRRPRLNPTFVEWMQGLDAGWVTDVPNIRREALLRMLGNGVVWQQAAAALLDLLDDGPDEAVAA